MCPFVQRRQLGFNETTNIHKSLSVAIRSKIEDLDVITNKMHARPTWQNALKLRRKVLHLLDKYNHIKDVDIADELETIKLYATLMQHEQELDEKSWAALNERVKHVWHAIRTHLTEPQTTNLLTTSKFTSDHVQSTLHDRIHLNRMKAFKIAA
jgi:hypothetical protein